MREALTRIESSLRGVSRRNPVVISITGPVAVGKSTLARQLREVLIEGPTHPKVDLASTDGFLYSTQVLTARGLMNQKGFPESYDQAKLIKFLTDLKAGVKTLSIPIYSHEIYDVTDKLQLIQSPDILILEGVNAEILTDNHFIDISIYIDAPEDLIVGWYLDRVKKFVKAAAGQEDSFFYPYTLMPEEKVLELAKEVWKTINAVNLVEHILPFRDRAQFIIEKGAGHALKDIREKS